MSSPPPSSQEWMILQCQACGSPMKVRAQTAAGIRVSCPSCHSPVAMQHSGAENFPEFRVDLPRSSPEATDAVKRRLAAEAHQGEEFAPTPGNRSLAEDDVESEETSETPETEDGVEEEVEETITGPEGLKRRVKRRRKKKAQSRVGMLADWNTVLDELPEAEVFADTWLNPVPLPEEVVNDHLRETVVSETSEEGQTTRRIKRVKRKAIFGFSQLFFRRLFYGVGVAAIAIAAVISFGGMTKIVEVIRQTFKPVTYDDSAEDLRPSRNVLNRTASDAAEEAVRKFLTEVGMEKKLPLVRLPKRVKPMMEEWYKEHPDRPGKMGEVRTRTKIRSSGVYFVIIEADVEEPHPVDPTMVRTVAKSFAVEEAGGEDDYTYRIDWETAVQWRPMSWEEFQTRKPQTPVPFRVKIEGSDYYNHGFSDQKKWLASQLYYPHPGGQNEFLTYAYLENRSPAWNDLAIYTEPGNKGSVIVNLRYPPDAISREQVIIDSLVLSSWFYTEDIPPEDLIRRPQ